MFALELKHSETTNFEQKINELHTFVQRVIQDNDKYGLKIA